jgi:hypothetical protein
LNKYNVTCGTLELEREEMRVKKKKKKIFKKKKICRLFWIWLNERNPKMAYLKEFR